MADENDTDNRDRRRSLERHIHTLLLSLVVGAAGYMIKLGIDSATQTNAIRGQVENNSKLLAVMYRSADAARDVAEITHRIDTNEKRIDVLDARINDVQNRVRYVEEHPTTTVHRP